MEEKEPKQPTKDASLEGYENQLMQSIRLKSVIIWLNCSPINDTNCQVSFPNNLGVLPDHKRKCDIKPVCANFSVILQDCNKRSVVKLMKKEANYPYIVPSNWAEKYLYPKAYLTK